MPAAIAKASRDRCAADAVHPPTLETAFARLDAAGIEYDSCRTRIEFAMPDPWAAALLPEPSRQTAEVGVLLSFDAEQAAAKPVAGGTISG